MKNRLEEIFKGEANETILCVLDELGYMPAPAQGAVVVKLDALEALAASFGYTAEQLLDPSGKAITSIGTEVQAAKDRVKKEVLAYVRAIFEICAQAGMLPMAMGLINDDVSISEISERIRAERENKSQRTRIHSTIGGVGADGANPLVEAAKKAAAAYAARNMADGTLPAARPGGDGGKRLH